VKLSPTGHAVSHSGQWSTGLKGWTDAQIAAAIRTGMKPDGKPCKPQASVAARQGFQVEIALVG